MPWKECTVMEELLRFVARLLEGEPLTEICRAFGISPKTGYKLFQRYRQDGPRAPDSLDKMTSSGESGLYHASVGCGP